MRAADASYGAGSLQGINAVTLAVLGALGESVDFYRALGFVSTFRSPSFATLSAPVVSGRAGDQPPNRLHINLFLPPAEVATATAGSFASPRRG